MNSQEILKLINDSEEALRQTFLDIEQTALLNQEKVLNAFRENRVALRHFAPTSGYGYDDIGRDTLCKLFADVFHTESAIVSPLIANGTHAISTVLFGLLRPGDVMLSISGNPYDTLIDVISGDNIGSLKEFGVKFEKVELNSLGEFQIDEIVSAISRFQPKIVFIQRSRGYSERNAFDIKTLESVIKVVKQHTSAPIVIDNCYGEFIEDREPTDVGADVIVGSLIKNPGGGLAPTGGYVAGKKDLIDLIAYRLTCPGIGMEVGSYASTYQYFYQGLFMAPHVVSQAKKAAQLFTAAFSALGYDVLPKKGQSVGDIIASIKFDTADQLIKFCQTIQTCSPVDSYLTPEPWDMPGYNHQVIMAAGSFVQGSSIEMSADSPIKEPYIAYFQGALTYEHAKIALKECLANLFKD